MQRVLVLLALLLSGCQSTLHADHAILGNYAGYIYPTNIGGPVCGAPCQKISAEWIVPTSTDSGTGGTQNTVTWIGLQSLTNTNGGTTNHCPGVLCLFQFGTYSQFDSNTGIATYGGWWELACGFSPCNTIQTIAGFVISPGDHIRATFQCITNCTDNNASMTERATIENLTTGVTWNNNNTDFAYSLAFSTALFVMEPPASGVKPDNFGVVHFANAKLSDVLVNLNLGAPEKKDSTNGGNRTMYPSAPIGDGSGFNVCYATGTYAAAPVCSGGTMRGSTSMTGP